MFALEVQNVIKVSQAFHVPAYRAKTVGSKLRHDSVARPEELEWNGSAGVIEIVAPECNSSFGGIPSNLITKPDRPHK